MTQSRHQMRRQRFQFLAIVAFAIVGTMLLLAPLQHASAQEAQLTGSVPTSGVALVSWSGGTLDELQAAARSQGCDVISAWLSVGGSLTGYVMGAPDFANVGFLAQYPGGVLPSTVLILLCSPYEAPLASAEAYYWRGLNYAQAGDYEKAKSDFDKAIEINPSYQEAYFRRGSINETLEDYAAAIADYTQALVLRPTDATAYFRRGITHGKADDPQNALADYTSAIELAPTFGAVYRGRGLLYLFTLDDPEKAIPDFTKCIEFFPDNPSFTPYCYWNRGQANERVGNLQQAILDLEQALSLFIAAGNTGAADGVARLLDQLRLQTDQPIRRQRRATLLS